MARARVSDCNSRTARAAVVIEESLERSRPTVLFRHQDATAASSEPSLAFSARLAEACDQILRGTSIEADEKNVEIRAITKSRARQIFPAR